MTDIPGAMIFIASVLILCGIFPLSAILVGWRTRNTVAAVAVGALLFPLLIIGGMIVSGSSVPEGWIRDAALYYAALGVTGGLAGLFASYGNRRDLLISGGFAVLWVCLFLSGIR